MLLSPSWDYEEYSQEDVVKCKKQCGLAGNVSKRIMVSFPHLSMAVFEVLLNILSH